MKQTWAGTNREIRKAFVREETFTEGIEKLILLRRTMFEAVQEIREQLPEEAFGLMPFAGADGYHGKTLSYVLWHVFRTEDIIAQEILAGDTQVLFAKEYAERLGTSILTTGDELKDEAITAFSKALKIPVLYAYAEDVMESTHAILRELAYRDLNRKPDEKVLRKLLRMGCVGAEAETAWLPYYWCRKDVQGLIEIPFSRSWILHFEAMSRIRSRLCRSKSWFIA